MKRQFSLLYSSTYTDLPKYSDVDILMPGADADTLTNTVDLLKTKLRTRELNFIVLLSDVEYYASFTDTFKISYKRLYCGTGIARIPAMIDPPVGPKSRLPYFATYPYTKNSRTIEYQGLTTNGHYEPVAVFDVNILRRYAVVYEHRYMHVIVIDQKLYVVDCYNRKTTDFGLAWYDGTNNGNAHGFAGEYFVFTDKFGTRLYLADTNTARVRSVFLHGSIKCITTTNDGTVVYIKHMTSIVDGFSIIEYRPKTNKETTIMSLGLRATGVDFRVHSVKNVLIIECPFRLLFVDRYARKILHTHYKLRALKLQRDSCRQ